MKELTGVSSPKSSDAPNISSQRKTSFDVNSIPIVGGKQTTAKARESKFLKNISKFQSTSETKGSSTNRQTSVNAPLSPTGKVPKVNPQLSEGHKLSLGSAEDVTSVQKEIEKPHYSDLQQILSHQVLNISGFSKLKSMIHPKIPYTSYFPLIRLKGVLFKMHRLKLSHYPRYLYLNPIEGVLISYKSQQKFP